MSRLSLTTNIASMNAQRNFTRASKDLETSFNRLSSGMRINRASDDAAGLSVSSLLNADRAVLAQGIRNLNDGISYLNIAESAIGEMTNIIFRISEISEQSANGTLSSAQRKPLQDEVTALQNEYNRILHSTKFNDMKLMTGSNTLVNLQGGYGVAGGLAVQVGNALLSDAFGLQSAGETIRLNTTSGGGQANGRSDLESVSADGRFLAFTSNATNLDPWGMGIRHTYVKNLETGELIIGNTIQGTQIPGGDDTWGAKLSADGRYLAFITNSSVPLIPGISGEHVYIKDLHTGNLRVGSITQDGVQANGTVADASISADGRFISFSSDSSNLIPGVTGASGNQIYVKNLETGELQLASSNQDGVQGNNHTYNANLSQDGRYVTFWSNSSNLISGVSGQQAYLKDLHTGKLQLLSSNEAGVQSNGSSGTGSALSADGRFFTFTKNSTNLISGVTGQQTYVKNIETGELRLVSSNKEGVQASVGSWDATISADGRYISFTADASNLVAGASGAQIYRKDMLTGDIELVSRSTDGETDANNGSYIYNILGIISPDGNKVYFHSSSDNLIAGDTNGVTGMDVFLRDLSKTGIDELSGMVVSNQATARTTLTLAKQRLETLNLARAGIGASSSRIDTAISNLSTTTQNLASAASQITDTDVADESAKLAASQILQQTGAAVLSQANLQPQLVLKLLEEI